MRIKRAAGKIAAFDFDRGHFAAAVVHAQDDFFGFRFIVDINFPNFHTAFTEEIFGAAAVAAPASSVNSYFFHLRRSGGRKEASNYLLIVWMRQEGSETQHDARRVRPGSGAGAARLVLASRASANAGLGCGAHAHKGALYRLAFGLPLGGPDPLLLEGFLSTIVRRAAAVDVDFLGLLGNFRKHNHAIGQ